ncbi:hypothetical protein [Bacillus sp. Marseille-P3661]|uniref:hypothetical protein n=1 Tax=Bacillus sp. Marseille-P3661 TaxID=1936234 RepID=UPI000C85966D|nr:hypothetical protein [Bacillus sp. Marseille-P3661]
MLVISTTTLVRTKVEQIKSGFSAFTETGEIARLIKRELLSLKVEVHIDETDKGYWFIPIERKTIT